MDLDSLHLRTPRLVLRPWQRADLDVMAAWTPFADPLEQTWNWTEQLRTISLDMFFAAHRMDATQHIWTLLVADEIIGLLLLHARTPASATLGISLRGDAIGHGYGGEALGALFDAYFEQWPDSTMRLDVALANRRAVRLYERLHFRETRRYWRDAGDARRYAFLQHRRYRDVQHLFRWTNDGLYQHCAEMELAAGTWRRFMV